MFDMRSRRTDKVMTKGLAQFQGPALLAFNSAIFEDKDFESIRRLGASRKYQGITLNISVYNAQI